MKRTGRNAQLETRNSQRGTFRTRGKMVRWSKVTACFFPLLVSGLLFSSAGCIPVKQTRVAAVALTLQDVAQAASKQSDANIVREGTPAYLMLVDGLIEAYPDNRELLLAGCRAYASYAAMFVAEEHPKKAEALYLTAKQYGFRALSERADFGRAAAGNLEEFKAFLERYKKEDVPALFWTANAWAGWIGSNLSNVEAVGDLPALEATLERILQLEDTYYYGGPHLLMGVYLAARSPVFGGGLAASKKHFDRALSLSGNKALGAKVLFAEYYAVGAKDRQLFETTLREVASASGEGVPELTLSNALAKDKAKRLLDKTEEYFGSQP
jgi:hypothetical protein